jgi:acetylornithine deacetylase/succinyl-diaminopimelate desuccinylase-like protein
MKGGVAMMTAAFLRAKVENLSLPGDVILAIVPDEEAGGEYGARFLVEQHPDLFAGVRYAIGEFGGFSMNVSGQKLYPIMVAEKQMCSMRAIVRGRGGHGSMPVRGGAMARLSRLLRRLDQNWLPIHVTPPVRAMIEAMAAKVGGAKGAVLRQLLSPATAEAVLGLLGPQRSIFEPLLRNTVSPTGLHASDKINVIPSQVSVDLDGRLLPGQTPDDMLRELQAVVGPEVELEVLRHEPGPPIVNMGLFDALAGVLREADPAGTPVPLVLSGVTDGRFFAALGIQTYGFLPMPLPDDFAFTGSIHAADERVPAAAIEFGANAIFAALGRFTP